MSSFIVYTFDFKKFTICLNLKKNTTKFKSWSGSSGPVKHTGVGTLDINHGVNYLPEYFDHLANKNFFDPIKVKPLRHESLNNSLVTSQKKIQVTAPRFWRSQSVWQQKLFQSSLQPECQREMNRG